MPENVLEISNSIFQQNVCLLTVFKVTTVIMKIVANCGLFSFQNTCAMNCTEKFLKTSQRIGIRFQEIHEINQKSLLQQ